VIMSSVFDIIKKRKSIRKCKKIPVENYKILQMIEAAILAPSATNRQPWRFIVVKDKALLKRITGGSLGAINRWAKTAPLLIVCCSIRKNVVTHFLGEIISRLPHLKR
ncbi:MAG TPA: hypothetical protein ENN92_00995, partial [candidate division WWE3 bacterium]|nr:hypothetical protein [candidate division WWE3 bacterium]